MTFPSLVRRSFVRTNAPPLPGLTCWNSITLKMTPSTSMWLPFLSWFVLITAVRVSRRIRPRLIFDLGELRDRRPHPPHQPRAAERRLGGRRELRLDGDHPASTCMIGGDGKLTVTRAGPAVSTKVPQIPR